MRIFHDWRELAADARGATVALGNFDGVHRGHAEVIKAAHAARPKVPLGGADLRAASARALPPG